MEMIKFLFRNNKRSYSENKQKKYNVNVTSIKYRAILIFIIININF